MRLGLSIIGIIIAFGLSGCVGQKYYGKVDKTPYATKECIKELSKGKELDHSKKIDKIIAYKSKRTMYVYKKGKVVGEYRFSLGKNGDNGPKVQAGDYKTPEGKYKIVRKKCDSRLYKSLMISYPNKIDRARARAKGVRTGGYITIHGQPKWNADGRGDSYTLSNDWTEGCMAVPNADMDELWRAVSNGVQIEIKA
ncbi:MAG: L,D-transpeptidase family protein [Sulfurovum sp.]|nr:L,D-transpeptidase family protein [Sulfurovum sp.]